MSARRGLELLVFFALVGSLQACGSAQPGTRPVGLRFEPERAPPHAQADTPRRIDVAYPSRSTRGFPLFVAFTATDPTDRGIGAVEELDAAGVASKWTGIDDGRVVERGSDVYVGDPFWHHKCQLRPPQGAYCGNECFDGPPAIRLHEKPRRFLTSVLGVESGCYTLTVSVRVVATPRDFAICVREPTSIEAAERANVARIARVDPEKDPWAEWMKSDVEPEALPIAGDDPIAYLRLERYIDHGERPLPPIDDAQFALIDPFFAPEVAELRVRAAAAQRDAVLFQRLAAEGEALYPEKWLDFQYARGRFAVDSGDLAAFDASSLALWDEHHLWSRRLDKAWNQAHPAEPCHRTVDELGPSACAPGARWDPR
jgi:hypothetical protein